jgi:hypothetical protein
MVANKINAAVDTVVVGNTSPLWAAGAAGVKLLAALQLKDEGRPIRFISAQSFLSLTD